MTLKILAIDDDPAFLQFLKFSLEAHARVTTCSHPEKALLLLKKNRVDMILLDISLGNDNGIDLLKRIKKENPETDIVMLTAHKDPKMIVECVRNGAFDYLVKPFEVEELLAILVKLKPIYHMREKNQAFIHAFSRSHQKMMGESPAFQKILKQASRVKGHTATVLIEGESGTGKELLARYLHALEESPSRPFIAVNCAAIPDTLIESELFGYERGAFTGAHARKMGKFEMAHDGDLFLDEISSLKWELQAKILRVLQEKEISRLGSQETISINFRLIAATNEDLGQLVDQGKFRRDLYHRLRVIPLKVPPLRERKKDIPLLAHFFLKKYDPQGTHTLHPTLLQTLMDYHWPGNIRELEHLIQSLVILSSQAEIKKGDLPDWILKKDKKDSFFAPLPESPKSLHGYLAHVEKEYISHILKLTHGDKTKAATFLKMSRTGLYERLKSWKK